MATQQYYTITEAIDRLRAKAGSRLGTDAKYFTDERCRPALVDSSQQWMPVMPPKFHTSDTLKTKTWYNQTGFESDLPTDCYFFDGLDGNGVKVDIEWDFAQFSRRRYEMRGMDDINLEVVCPRGNKLLVAPTPTITYFHRISYYAEIPDPADVAGNYLWVPKGPAFNFVTTAALVEAMQGEMRTSDSAQNLVNLFEAMKMVFGIEDRMNELKRRGQLSG